MTAPRANRATLGFWLLAISLVLYVGVCTGFRDNQPEADAWEHLSVLRALTENLWNPGNPTYALEIPSARYSPYFVGLAIFCRLTHIDPYLALSIAAVLNTVLLTFGIWLLLSSFEEASSAGAALLLVVSLYGAAPGYANSLALADLPWLQVNPSAFSLPLVLISWALFHRTAVNLQLSSAWAWLVIILISSCAFLDHAMTGAFGFMGLFVLAASGDEQSRWRMTLAAAAVSALAIIIALGWPWFSLIAALRSNRDRDYWFNPYILKLMFSIWCAPAALCGLFLLPMRARPLIRSCLLGGTLSLAIGLFAFAIKSPTLARFPMAGMIYFQLAIGVFVHNSEISKPSEWSKLTMQLLSPNAAESNRAIIQMVVAAFLVFFLTPQLIQIATQPYLARKYVAKLTGRSEKVEHPRQTMSDLLASISPRDTVLSDIDTSWQIPGTRGRIVAALHYELFVPNQTQRTADLNRFFSSTNETERDDVIKRYSVDWILLNRKRLGEAEFSALLRKSAVVKSSTNGDLVLMRSDAWMRAGATVSRTPS